MNKTRFLFGLCWLLCLSAFGYVPTDSLPAGTKINLTIQQPGQSTANRISYTIPGPTVVAPPVVVPPVIRDPNVLIDGQVFGTKGTNTLKVRGVNGKLFLTEELPDGTFLFRGVNLLNRSDVQTNYGSLRSQLSGGDTEFGGLSEPSGVSAPSGFVRRKFADGAVYYGPSDSSPPVEHQAPPTGNNNASRIGTQLVKPYALEPAGQLRPPAIGSDYYSPNFRFSVDYWAERTIAERKAVGENLIQIGSLDDAQKGQLARGDAILYFTESSLHGWLEGALYFESSLQEYYSGIYSRIPNAGYDGPDKGVGIVAFNIEVSNVWNRQAYNGSAHWPTWEQAKHKRIVCELDGVTRTLEELDNSGLWPQEEAVRRGNRLGTLFAYTRERIAPHVLISYGSSMYQGQSDLSKLGTAEPFLESYPDVRFAGGSTDGTITFQRPGGGTATYKLSGSQYQNEDVMMGYYYLFHFSVPESAIQIWHNPLGKTYRDLWPVIEPISIVADEKAYIQQNEAMMLRKYGKVHPILRLWEPVYEDNIATIVNGQPRLEAARTPFSVLRGGGIASRFGDIPKIWQPPILSYGRYATIRFWAGNRPGYGIHAFPAGPARGVVGLDWYNQLLHTYSAVYQARQDMQELEDWYEGSTLVENPEILVNGTGSWIAPTGPEAYAYSNGTFGTPLPAVIPRYKANDDGSTTVYILASFKQANGASSTHVVRVPGALNNNTFQIQLIGSGAHLYKFTVLAGDSGQTYPATAITPLAGYSGLASQN